MAMGLSLDQMWIPFSGLRPGAFPLVQYKIVCKTYIHLDRQINESVVKDISIISCWFHFILLTHGVKKHVQFLLNAHCTCTQHWGTQWSAIGQINNFQTTEVWSLPTVDYLNHILSPKPYQALKNAVNRHIFVPDLCNGGNPCLC